MTLQTRVRKGSFRGIPFDTISIGRKRVKKNSEHQFANSVRRYIEERGVQNADFTVTLSIFGKDDYFDKRDALRTALEAEGEGVLVLPLEGEFNVKCTDVSDNQELLGNLGRCDFTCTFNVVGENEKGGNPITVKNSKISLFNKVRNIRNKLANTVNGKINFSNALNYANSLSRYTNFANTMAGLASLATSGSSLRSLATNFGDSLSTILGSPVLLGSAVNTVFNQFEAVFDVASVLFSSSETLFAFGDTDLAEMSSVPLNTPERIERVQNAQAEITQIQLSALGIACNAFAQMSFDNEDELEQTRQVLTAQFNKLENSDFMKNADIDGVYEISENLKDMRNDFSDVIAEKKAIVPKLTNYNNTKSDSVSMVAYRLYNSLENVDGLIDLNGIQNPKSLEGTMRVYTNVG